jgi:riboflavin synthase
MSYKKKVTDYIHQDIGLYKIEDSLIVDLTQIVEEANHCINAIKCLKNPENIIYFAVKGIRSNLEDIEMLLNDQINVEDFCWEEETSPEAKKLRNEIVSLTEEYNKNFRKHLTEQENE